MELSARLRPILPHRSPAFRCGCALREPGESRMPSASVGSPICSCQHDTGSCEVRDCSRACLVAILGDFPTIHDACVMVQSNRGNAPFVPELTPIIFRPRRIDPGNILFVLSDQANSCALTTATCPDPFVPPRNRTSRPRNLAQTARAHSNRDVSSRRASPTLRQATLRCFPGQGPPFVFFRFSSSLCLCVLGR